jgi:hypothetical protein
MAIRKFLTSVADVYAYDTQTDALVFTAKTLLDSSIETSLGSAPVRGGRGNQLQYIYYHTGEMKFTLTDTQFNLGLLGATVGSDIGTSVGVYKEESVALTSASTATVSGCPLAFAGSGTIYGWGTTHDTLTIYRGSFSGKNFSTLVGETLGITGEQVCIRYYENNSAAQYLTIKASMVPKVVKLVMEAQLNSADVTTNKIGIVQIIAPTVTLSGAFTISMKADGVSNTPLTATALAYTPTAVESVNNCAIEPYYARIIEVIDAANWYDNVVGLSIAGGDFTMANSASTVLNVWAVPSTGAAFKISTSGSNLTFGIDVGGTATDMTTGSYTGSVWAGTVAGWAIVNCNITAVPTIDTSVCIVVSA